MSVAEPRQVPRWVRYFVDYAGLAIFLVALVATRSAVTASWAIVGGSILALVVGLFFERRLAPMPLVTAVLGLIFGGLTIFFHDERFIKVKPTILADGLRALPDHRRIAWQESAEGADGRRFSSILPGSGGPHAHPALRRLFFFALALANEAVWRTQSTR